MTGIRGKCPHCGGLFEYSHEYLEQMADAALEATERAIQRREADASVPVMIPFHIQPSACTGIDSKSENNNSVLHGTADPPTRQE